MIKYIAIFKCDRCYTEESFIGGTQSEAFNDAYAKNWNSTYSKDYCPECIKAMEEDEREARS